VKETHSMMHTLILMLHTNKAVTDISNIQLRILIASASGNNITVVAQLSSASDRTVYYGSVNALQWLHHMSCVVAEMPPLVLVLVRSISRSLHSAYTKI